MNIEDFIIEFVEGQQPLEHDIVRALNSDFLDLYESKRPEPPRDVRYEQGVLIWAGSKV